MLHLIILTGKTASGKDTVMKKILARFLDFKRVITTTSRMTRAGEKNGVDYNFISEIEFKQKIAAGELIEYVEYGGNLYGTEKRQLTDNLDSNLIWRIDPSRAGQIRQFIRDSFDQTEAEELLKRVVVIYLTVDDQVIIKRLEERGFTKEEIARRMQEDTNFWQQYKDAYDFVVENVAGQLDKTVDEVVGIIKKHINI